MRKIVRCCAGYFYWLVFSIFVMLASEMMRQGKSFLGAYLPDVFASYALVGTYGTLLALPGAGLLAIVEQLGQKLHLKIMHDLPRFISLGLFMVAWLSMLSSLMTRQTWWLLAGGALVTCLALVGGLVYEPFRARIVSWIGETTGRLRIITLLTTAVFASLSSWLFLKSYGGDGLIQVSRANSSQNPPNIIVIILDGLTSHDMSLYGYLLPTTPNLDRLAQNWTIYDNAHSAGTGTVVKLPAMLTGRYPYFDELYRYGDLTATTAGWLSLPQILRSIGYETVYVNGGGFPLSIHHFQADFDKNIRLGRGWYLDQPVANYPAYFTPYTWSLIMPESSLLDIYLPSFHFWPVDSELSEPMYGYTKQYLRERVAEGKSSPFFLYMHMLRPHYPFLANEFQGRFLPKAEGLTSGGSQSHYVFKPYSPDQQPIIDRLRLRYDENILKADEQVADLIKTLQELGLYDSSLIVITADHGTNFVSGHQGYYTAILAAAEHSIPLLIHFPYQTEGRRVTGLVSDVDVMPTVLDVLGVSYPTTWVDGQSLMQVEQNDDRIVYVRRPGDQFMPDDIPSKYTFAALNGKSKLVSRKGELFLFNLAQDPDEQVNLLGQCQADSLRDALDQFEERMQALQASEAVTTSPGLITTLTSPLTCQGTP